MCKNTGCNNCSQNCGCSCNACCNNDCNNCNEQPCGCPFEVDFACVRYTGNELPCLDLSEGETLEQLAKKLDELLCGLSPGVDGDSIQVTPEPAGENCANGGFLVELIDGLDGVTVLSSYYICNALDGGPGAPGFSGRGVAVFVQNTEPNQTDFNNQYGLIEGFGQNGIPGSNQIKPGDIWIENCQ